MPLCTLSARQHGPILGPDRVSDPNFPESPGEKFGPGNCRDGVALRSAQLVPPLRHLYTRCACDLQAELWLFAARWTVVQDSIGSVSLSSFTNGRISRQQPHRTIRTKALTCCFVFLLLVAPVNSVLVMHPSMESRSAQHVEVPETLLKVRSSSIEGGHDLNRSS